MIFIIFILVSQSNAEIFLLTKDAKLYKTKDINSDCISVSQGEAFNIAETSTGGNLIKLRITNTSYKFIESKNGIIRKDGTWPITDKVHIPQPPTKEELERKKEWSKKYDDMMDQAWGGKERDVIKGYPIYGLNAQAKANNREPTEYENAKNRDRIILCNKVLAATVTLYTNNKSAFRDSPTSETWRKVYQECLEN
jgi:hypothetical protein